MNHMEQQNQQPIQEQRNLHSGKKFLEKHKLSLIAAIIVIVLTVGGIVLLQLKKPQRQRIYSFFYVIHCQPW